MPPRVRRSASGALLLLLGGCAAALGQDVSAGFDLSPGVLGYSAPVAATPAGPKTVVSLPGGATGRGSFASATFGWSATGCPGAVKLKFYRGQDGMLIGERGPFDVTNPLVPAGTGLIAIQTVALDPPVDGVEAGDLVAITSLTSCGTPVWLEPPPRPLPTLPPWSFVHAGDVSSFAVAPVTSNFLFVFVSARGVAAPVTSVPTLTPWAVAFMTGLLAFVGFRLSRR